MKSRITIHGLLEIIYKFKWIDNLKRLALNKNLTYKNLTHTQHFIVNFRILENLCKREK